MNKIPFIIILFLLTACTSTIPLRKGVLIKTELYFGMNIPSGGVVTQAEWAQFLAAEVSPRFEDGLTVFQAQGQWLGEDKIVAKEQSRVVVLLYQYSNMQEQAISEIITAYKTQFQQEAVMRVDSRVRLAFE